MPLHPLLQWLCLMSPDLYVVPSCSSLIANTIPAELSPMPSIVSSHLPALENSTSYSRCADCSRFCLVSGAGSVQRCRGCRQRDSHRSSAHLHHTKSAFLVVMAPVQRCKDDWQHSPKQHSAQLHHAQSVWSVVMIHMRRRTDDRQHSPKQHSAQLHQCLGLPVAHDQHSDVLTLHASALSVVVVSVQRCKYDWQHATHQHSAQLHQRQALPVTYDFWQNVYTGRIQKGACAGEYESDHFSRQRRVTEQAP